MIRFHGFGYRTGDKQPIGQVPPGKFGRMFPKLTPFTPPEKALEELGKVMIDPAVAPPQDEDLKGDNPAIPAGYTYLGQFIDHDITFDTTSLQERLVDPLAIRNFRSPALDLDSVYGTGPEVQPYFYELNDDAPLEKFLIGKTTPGGADPSIQDGLPNDLPRAASTLAIIGDPRNDENLIVAQLHLAFLKFHNKVVDGLKNKTIPRRAALRKSVFEEARDIVVWHYQWIVLNDFLRRIIDPAQLDLVLKQGRKFYRFESETFIPVEFSAAAYRLGHSMIRSVYDYNRVFTPKPGGVTPATLGLLFAFTAKSGRLDDFATMPLPSDWIIDWRRFFEIDPAIAPQASRKLDPFLTNPLSALPDIGATFSLAERNLKRGRSMGLPAGQSIARFMGYQPLTPDQIRRGKDGAIAEKYGLDVETPLWYYILKEAEVQTGGKHLGQVGSRILAEVFVGLLQGDDKSFLSHNPYWKPFLPAKTPGTFTMVDMLKFVDDISPIDNPANITR